MSFVKFNVKDFLVKSGKQTYPLPTIPTLPTISEGGEIISTFVGIVGNVATPSVENENFKSILKLDITKDNLMPAITQKAIRSPPRTVYADRCIYCPKWLKKAGSAWWIGLCGENLQDVSFRSTCQFVAI